MTSNDQAKWPIGAILGYGTFGSSSPAGRRYHLRSGVALLALVSWILLASFYPKSVLQPLTPIAPGLAFLYIVYEFRRYLLSLDEWARRLQMEAMAWTYLTGLALAMIIGGIGARAGWEINPMWFVVLEPIRTAFLYTASRRY